jgi:aminoglycoside phosphotransferase family enzyme/adenylate kinase family enzyme
MDTARSRLVAAMMRPDFYPEKPPAVEFRQTHMSCVFIAGDLVYKIKKPVHFGFVDAFDLCTRFLFCREEVRLNRRLAPGVYLDVVPIIDDGSRYVLGGPDDLYQDRVCEYAVKMRRLPEDRMLDYIVRAGAAGSPAIEAIARKLVSFHAGVSSARADCYGSPAAVRRVVLGNIEECRPHVGYTLEPSEFEALERYLGGFIDSHRELLNKRAMDGRIREGHGDLRCEHVCMNENLDIVDCVEFDEALRYADVASEIAFLAMDMDSMGVSHLADELVELYARMAEDPDLATLSNFYKCHRACVRGKVDTLKSLDQEVPAAERERARDRARSKFALALSYAARGRPALLVVCGLVGSGKSTAAERLRRLTGFEIFNSDRIRKRLAGISEREHPRAEYGGGIYGAGFDRLTYDTLIDHARRSLSEGRGAVLDATFKSQFHRRAAMALAEEMRVPILFVECRVDEEEALRRLTERAAQGTDISDATPEVYRHQRLEYPPIREVPAKCHLVFDTTIDGRSAVRSLEQALAMIFEPEGIGSGHPGAA